MSSGFQLHVDTVELAARVIGHATQGDGRGQAYGNMADFVDRFGSRMVGSQALESAIDWTVEALKADGLVVSTEEFAMPGWSRGDEAAFITAPVSRQLNILGLGYSAATPESGLETECLVVRSWDELEAAGVAGRLRGRIAVFNQAWAGYDTTRHFRNSGPARAAKFGALAALVRAVAPFSINTPHAGVTLFDDVPAIPAACIAPEDAELLDRMQARGETVRLRLSLRCTASLDAKSRNIVADLPGSDATVARELVVLCAHLDSWDVGQGAMDDAGGAFVAWEAIRALRALGHRPRRTVRLILFSGEELGLWGGRRYFEAHERDLADRLSFMLESDGGTFAPLGVTCSGAPATREALQLALEPLQAALGAGGVFEGTDGPDIVQWAGAGVPIGNLVTQRAGQSEDFYFYFHHTRGDTVSVQDPGEMDRCVAAMATVALVLGNADTLLPR